MNTIDVKGGGDLIKGVGELIKSAEHSDGHRQAFGRTFFGTLLGQTVALLSMTLTYIVTVAVIWRYFFEDLKALRSAMGEWVWLILAAPFICILLFSMLPTTWRALRERRMKAAIIDGDSQFQAINFRPYPYGEADRETFKRLDGPC